MKSNGKLAAKTAAKRKTTSTKTTAAKAKPAAKTAASKNGKKRQAAKSTVPPQFRALKQLAAAKDPRFWDLRRKFYAYFYALPEEERGPFLEGLSQPYLDYLVMAMIAARGRKEPANGHFLPVSRSARETR